MIKKPEHHEKESKDAKPLLSPLRRQEGLWWSRHLFNLLERSSHLRILSIGSDLIIAAYLQSLERSSNLRIFSIWSDRHLRTDLHIIAHKTFTTIFSIWSNLNIAASGTISGKVFHNRVFNLPFNKHTGVFNTPKKDFLLFPTIPDERPIPEDWPSLSDQKQTLVVDRLITEPATQISAMRC